MQSYGNGLGTSAPGAQLLLQTLRDSLIQLSSCLRFKEVRRYVREYLLLSYSNGVLRPQCLSPERWAEAVPFKFLTEEAASRTREFSL